ncbi:MAG: glycosyltransferase [Candidatus Taylorbacteria bacterium]|nr:glycosyltransferase [Candidatus Taylorbacteria bacterium]
MKILYLAGQFYPDLAGSSVTNTLIVSELTKIGHDVTVVAGKKNTMCGLSKEKKIFPFHLKRVKNYIEFAKGNAGFVEPTRAIYDLITKNQYDIVHATSFMSMLILSLMRQTLRQPIVFSFWSTPIIGQRALGLYHEPVLDLELARNIISFRAFDKIVLGSEHYRKAAISLGAKEKDIKNNLFRNKY